MIKHIKDFIKFRLDDLKMYLTYEKHQEQYWKEAGKTYRNEKMTTDMLLKENTEHQLYEIKKACSGKGKILDVGCAYGRLTTPLGADGIDFSPDQLAFNETAGQLYQGDISNLPMPSGSYELVFSSGVLMHNPPEKAKKIIEEMIRVANKGMIFEEVGRTSPYLYNHDYTALLTRFGLKFTIEDFNDEYLKAHNVKMKLYKWNC